MRGSRERFEIEKVQRNAKDSFFRVRTRSKAMRRDTLYRAQINSLFACMIYRGRSYGWVLTLGVILSDDEQVLVSSDLLIADITNVSEFSFLHRKGRI